MHKNSSPVSPNPAHAPGAVGHINGLRSILINRLWYGVLALALLGAPTSILRMVSTGWQFSYTVHLCMALAILAAHLLAGKARYELKAGTIMATLMTAAVLGLVNFGLVSQGGGILIVFMILSGLLFSRGAALSMSGALVAVMLTIGVGFITGRLQVNFDANAYMHSFSGWLFFFLGATLFGGFVAIAVLVQREFIDRLLTENELQKQHIVHQSHHDALTSLPTLRLAMDRLQVALHAAARSSQKVALMFVDLDDFKKVNDTHGHAAGDALLRQAAERMTAVVRPEDTVARIGGDEFLIVLDRQTDLDHAAGIARRIISALTMPFYFEGQSLSVGCSVGISFAPDHASDPDGLRRAADAAMYGVKKTGKNSFAFAAAGSNTAPEHDSGASAGS